MLLPINSEVNSWCFWRPVILKRRPHLYFEARNTSLSYCVTRSQVTSLDSVVSSCLSATQCPPLIWNGQLDIGSKNHPTFCDKNKISSVLKILKMFSNQWNTSLITTEKPGEVVLHFTAGAILFETMHLKGRGCVNDDLCVWYLSIKITPHKYTRISRCNSQNTNDANCCFDTTNKHFRCVLMTGALRTTCVIFRRILINP